ncbi:DUF4272 domain-containing protein [Paenalcaligenes sp. Me52]|uniref:DUF4272 domain-containing protein n=1 Tax=Paenalcaligenes sp. Me52 TaxID=3392038 RepID=UPI0026C8550C
MGLLKRILGKRQATTTETSADTSEEVVLVNAYATVTDIPELDFPHELLGQRDLSDPDLAEHLDGFIGYVMSRGDGQMTAMRYHLWRHLQRVQNHISMKVKQQDLSAMSAWAARANALLFMPDGSVRTPDLTLLMTADGLFFEHEALPYLPDALARREKSLKQLAQLNPTPPASMPPVLAEAEVHLRSVSDVVHRALSLFCVASEGLVILDKEDSSLPFMAEHNPVGLAMLSPQEKAFISAEEPDEHMAIQMSWRHEALNVLLWALSKQPEPLSPASDVVESQVMFDKAMRLIELNNTGHVFTLRPTAEILDQLDLTWRQHWITRQAAQSDADVEGLISGVVMERHYALNWLTNFQNDIGTAWDDIDTPT